MEPTQKKLERLQQAMRKAKEFLESGGDLDSQDAVPLSHELLDATDDMAEALPGVRAASLVRLNPAGAVIVATRSENGV